MTDELKPVPCGCGGEAKVRGINHFWVDCKKCHTSTTVFDSESEAVEAWNKAMSGNVVVYGNPDAPKSKTVG